MLTLTPSNRAGVNRVVDRQHVSASNLQVCRAVRKAIKPRTRVKVPRDLWRAIYREAIAQHKSNLVLYCYVMGGRT